MPDMVRPLAAGTAGPAPADVVEEATEAVDLVTPGATGGGIGTDKARKGQQGR